MLTMRRVVSVVVLGAAAIGCHATRPNTAEIARPVAIAAPRILVMPDRTVWQEGPDSLRPGAKMVVLEGDPSKDGFFTMRLLLPDGYRVDPHWHAKAERLTIISGTLNLGMGDHFETQAAPALPAGTYSSMPPGMTHFAWTTGATVLQLSSIGPWSVIYVNPADDPRNKQR
jgi:hypothetical protein